MLQDAVERMTSEIAFVGDQTRLLAKRYEDLFLELRRTLTDELSRPRHPPVVRSLRWRLQIRRPQLSRRTFQINPSGIAAPVAMLVAISTWRSRRRS